MDSIHLAVDTGISDIVIVGDFNWNAHASPASHKIASICNQFALKQFIDEPTHYTENSESLLDLLFVSNPSPLIAPRNSAEHYCGGLLGDSMDMELTKVSLRANNLEFTSVI